MLGDAPDYRLSADRCPDAFSLDSATFLRLVAGSVSLCADTLARGRRAAQ